MSNCVVMARLHIAGVSRHATDNRECHGVALAGHDECAAGAGTSCARAEEKDYRGDALIIVEKGNCTTIKTPNTCSRCGSRRDRAREARRSGCRE
jgi:uncharacterized membrane protein